MWDTELIRLLTVCVKCTTLFGLDVGACVRGHACLFVYTTNLNLFLLLSPFMKSFLLLFTLYKVNPSVFRRWHTPYFQVFLDKERFCEFNIIFCSTSLLSRIDFAYMYTRTHNPD